MHRGSRIAELAPPLFENIPVQLAGIDPICLGQTRCQIGLDAIVIKERIVDIEKKTRSCIVVMGLALSGSDCAMGRPARSAHWLPLVPSFPVHR